MSPAARIVIVSEVRRILKSACERGVLLLCRRGVLPVSTAVIAQARQPAESNSPTTNCGEPVSTISRRRQSSIPSSICCQLRPLPITYPDNNPAAKPTNGECPFAGGVAAILSPSGSSTASGWISRASSLSRWLRIILSVAGGWGGHRVQDVMKWRVVGDQLVATRRNVGEHNRPVGLAR